ncbi:MAG: hypothetical protein IJK46_10885 [Prevotella sp.]|nr:hypothetical protein [Prevotella sp.]MBQ6730267.1 hypothetical protein [Bacteroidales bacterium]
MEEYVKPVKKPRGCLKAFGWLLTVGSVLFIAICIAMIFEGEKHMDELRAEYSASTKEYEEALEAYNADSVHMQAEYHRILEQIDKAEAAGDSITAMELTDSLKLYAEPEWVPRGAIGFNIGGAFFLFFALCALVPLLIGIFILIYCHNRKRKYRKWVNLTTSDERRSS